MSHKNIVMISYHTCPLASLEGKETGGMNVYVLELSKVLAKKGYKVDIYTRCQDKSNENIVNVSENLRVIHLKAGASEHLAKKSLINYIGEFVESYQDFVTKENLNYDVMHCHYYLSGLIGLKIREQNSQNIPILMSFHTLALMKNLVARSKDEEETPARIEAEFLLCEKVDKIITSSLSDALYTQYLYNALPKQMVVIPPGIDVTNFFPIDKLAAKKEIHEDTDKIVLFVGRIEPLKGIDALIYAMKILVTRNPKLQVKLLIAGGDVTQKSSVWTGEIEKLNQLRTILKIPDIVEFVGQKTQQELPFYYNSAEVVIMPSHYESFGIAAIEAMACGTPVITSNVSGVASIIDEKHEQLITTVNNPLLLASQMENLLINETEHKKISDSIRDKVSDLTWENTAEKLIEVYNSVIN